MCLVNHDHPYGPEDAYILDSQVEQGLVEMIVPLVETLGRVQMVVEVQLPFLVMITQTIRNLEG